MPAKPNSDKKPLICRCSCPYCEAEIVLAESPFCDVCKKSFGRCPSCGAVILEEKIKVCKSCGSKLS